jgi:hypothetical protein
MKESIKKLLLVIPIREQDDLMQVVESEGWNTVKDLFRKTGTSYNTHWNGNFVLDQDEIPWKASPEEINALETTKGKVVVLSGTKYAITRKISLYADSDGSVYAVEEDLADFFENP